MFNYHVIFQSFRSRIFLITMVTLKKSFLFGFWNFFCMATRNMGFQTHFTNINVRAMWANVFFPVFINWRKGSMGVTVMSSKQSNSLRGIDKKTVINRKFQFVYLCSLQNNTSFKRKQNGSKLQYFLLFFSHPKLKVFFFQIK